MGLAEKRAIEGFKSTGFSEFLTQLKGITKFDVPVEVEWDKFGTAIEGYSDAAATISDFFTHLFGETILQSFKAVCVDDMGREALQGKLKKIFMTTGPDGSTHGAGFKFDNGTLSMNMRYANTDDVKERVTSMQKLLESQL